MQRQALGPLIAIVDDDKAVRDALQRMLRSHGFAAAAFASGQHFLDAAEAACATCLIADVRMPGLSGLELHDRLRSHMPTLPTILITACPTSHERRQAMATGVLSYLAKPLDERILLDIVRKALENTAPVANTGTTGHQLPRI